MRSTRIRSPSQCRPHIPGLHEPCTASSRSGRRATRRVARRDRGARQQLSMHAARARPAAVAFSEGNWTPAATFSEGDWPRMISTLQGNYSRTRSTAPHCTQARNQVRAQIWPKPGPRARDSWLIHTYN